MRRTAISSVRSPASSNSHRPGTSGRCNRTRETLRDKETPRLSQSPLIPPWSFRLLLRAERFAQAEIVALHIGGGAVGIECDDADIHFALVS